MLIHRPYLTAVTCFCLAAVTSFYLYVGLCGRSNKVSRSDVQKKQAARARKKKEMLEKKKEQERKEEERARRRIEAKEGAVAQLRKRGVNSRQDQVEDEESSYSDSEPEDTSNGNHLHKD